jgi:hypothetical protein
MIGRFQRRRPLDTLSAAATTSSSALMLLATGCSREPTLNILGSFFPAWILCGLIGIVLTVMVRLAFLRLKFEQQLSLPLLVYPCLAACLTFTIWLVFFS